MSASKPSRAGTAPRSNGHRRERERPTEQVLSATSDQSLREEAIARRGTARSWRETRKQFADYLMTQNAAAKTWERTKGVRPQSHRFTERYAKQKTGKIHGGLSWVEENAPDTYGFHTVLLTRTGWPFDVDGNAAPPAEYLSSLVDARQKALRTLRSILDGTEDVLDWGRVTVVEPHERRRSGYPHEHDGVAIVGDISNVDFRPVIEDYVDDNPFARERDHGERAITKDSDGQSLAAELTNSMVGYDIEDGHPIHDTPDAVLRFASLMWATGKQSVSFGERFKEWVGYSQANWEPDSEEEYIETVPNPEDVDPVEYIEPKPTEVAYQYPA